MNAAGAWCGVLAEKMGAQKIPLQSYRRHLYLTEPVKLRQDSWPFVWDLSQDFYFRPEGKSLLLSPCDKVLVDKSFLKRRQEEVDQKMKQVLLQKIKKYPNQISPLKIKSGRSGLRTMVPDGRFVVGEDAALKSFYWVAGLGGHGVTTCFSVGKLASDIILGKKVSAKFTKAFNPRRFL